MLLAIDVGNTNTKIGLIKEGQVYKKLVIGNGAITDEAVKELVKGIRIQGAAILSVRADLNEQVLGFCSGICPSRLITATDCGVDFSMYSVASVGVDRVVNAMFAYKYFNAPSVVVDFGTCTTISAIGRDKKFLSGAILPGVHLMLTCLKEQFVFFKERKEERKEEERKRNFEGETFSKKSFPLKLPLQKLLYRRLVLFIQRSVVSKSSRYYPPFRDTHSTVSEGIALGVAGAIERIVYELKRNVGYSFKVAVTGGGRGAVLPYLRSVDLVDEDLSLKAVELIYKL
ncbi:MAG: type III pantothenate kinase [Candidatus Magnetoovum sp. WYHC-5]|nr:type III pantothenate kinase [Candidatus Magnetoovum sp. WYHC-5]